MVKSIHRAVENNLSHITTYQAGIAQAAMHRNVQKISNEILKPFGITKMQWLIIGIVLDAGEGGVRISDMAESLGVTMPYITNTLKLLESRNYIQRSTNSSDNRSKIVKINPEHIEEFNKIEEVLRAGLRNAIYDQVSREDFIAYIRVVFQLQMINRHSHKALSDISKVADANKSF